MYSDLPESRTSLWHKIVALLVNRQHRLKSIA